MRKTLLFIIFYIKYLLLCISGTNNSHFVLSSQKSQIEKISVKYQNQFNSSTFLFPNPFSKQKILKMAQHGPPPLLYSSHTHTHQHIYNACLLWLAFVYVPNLFLLDVFFILLLNFRFTRRILGCCSWCS